MGRAGAPGASIVEVSATRVGPESSGFGAGQTSRLANGARAWANASADGGRAAGSEARARATISTSPSGSSGCTDSSGTAGWVEMWCRIALFDSPGWGLCREQSSYRIAPRAYTSARWSTILSPRACSGDMYATVPRIVPVRVAAPHLVDGLQLRDAEIEHLEQVGPVIAPAHEQVLRLEVAMDDPRRVRDLDSPTGLRGEIGRARHGQAPLSLEQRSEALADEVLHHDVRRPVGHDAEVDRGGDVLALERPGRLGLALKPGQDVATLGEVGPQELDRESPLHDGVLRLVDDAHPPLGEHADDPVLGPDDLADPAGRLGARGHDWPSSCAFRSASRSTAWPSIRR